MFEEFSLSSGSSRRQGPGASSSALIQVQQLEDRVVASVNFGYDATHLHTVAVDGVNLLTGGGGYGIGSRYGTDDPSSNYSTVSSNGSTMTNGGPAYRLTFWQKSATTLGFRAEFGPVTSSQADPHTGMLTRLSLPFDFRKDLFSQFAFNGSAYYLNGSNNATGYSSGSRVNYSSIPAPTPIHQYPGGPIIGYTGVAITKQATSWGELTGSLATLRFNIDVSKSTNYRTMEFYNHFGTNNIELQFGPLAVGQRASAEGEIIVTPKAFNLRLNGASSAFGHETGRAEGNSWSVRVGDPTNKFMTFGPAQVSVPTGNRTATFRLKLDNVTADNNNILRIEVWNRATGQPLKSQVLRRRDFAAANTYQNFSLNFNAAAGQQLEFRVFWYGGSYAALDYVDVV